MSGFSTDSLEMTHWSGPERPAPPLPVIRRELMDQLERTEAAQKALAEQQLKLAPQLEEAVLIRAALDALGNTNEGGSDAAR
jgi:hypothetical protein